MATKFAIRNYSRTGNQVTFTVVALTTDGLIDGSFTGAFTWGLTNVSDPGSATFTGGDQGQRTYTVTILDLSLRAGVAAIFPGGTSTGANLSIMPPSGAHVSVGAFGDHLLVGGVGNDTYSASGGDDLFLLHQGGVDVANGNGGDDTFYFGAAYTSADTVNGGAGTRDQVLLQGNYSGGVTLGSLVQTERVVLLPGNDTRFGDTAGNTYRYDLTASASTIVTNNRLTIDAAGLRANETFTFDGSATAIDYLIHAGQGANLLIGGSGNDGFYFGAHYSGNDIVSGGAGTDDQIGLQGNYSAGVTLGLISGIELIALLPGNDARFGGHTGTNLSYNITAPDAAVAAGATLRVQANTLRAGENFTFNGSAETDGNFVLFGGLGTENLTGGAGNDGFFFGQGRFNPGDTVNGGGGIDQIALQGNYSGLGAITFGASQLSNVEFIVLLSAVDGRFGASGGVASYTLTMHNGNVAAGQQMIISANTLRAGENLEFRGMQEADGRFIIYSGAGNDILFGSQGADQIFGGAGVDYIQGMAGADMLWGGAGNDFFGYAQVTESTALAPDQIRDFATGDLIDLTSLRTNTGGGNITFVGNGTQTGARQVQVVQNGNAATVNFFLDGDANADMVINVTVADGHALTIADFIGVSAPSPQEPLPVKQTTESGLRAMLWDADRSIHSLDRPVDQDLHGSLDPLQALNPTSDLLV